jgi:3-deoxy-D-manno-octulosonic-acid transferase
LLLALPLIFFGYVWRVFVTRKASESWRANLGALPNLANRDQGKKLVWMHAASVGEVIASQPVLDALRDRLQHVMVLLTTITQTGNEVARNSPRRADVVSYFPLDLPPIVRAALNRVMPDVFVMVETEIWPNFLAFAKRLGIPTILVNGRISDKSFQRGRRWRWLLGWAVRNIDYCCMQSKLDAERIIQLGARPESVRVLGNTKFDQEGAHLNDDEVRRLRAELGIPENSPVFIAGSTNPGEEGEVLRAFRRIRESVPDLRLIIAPRQIERSDEIEGIACQMGFSCARRSSRARESEYDVLILDTFGELAAVYSVACVTFVGGSLIPKGGHSIFQPIIQGKPVMFGPYMHNFRDISHQAIAAGIGFEVHNDQEMASVAKMLMADERRLTEIKASCEKLVMENRGASERYADLIATVLARDLDVHEFAD